MSRPPRVHKLHIERRDRREFHSVLCQDPNRTYTTNRRYVATTIDAYVTCVACRRAMGALPVAPDDKPH